MTAARHLDARRRVRGHPLRALGHRHRQGHDRPPRGPQRLPAADRARADRRLRPHPRRRVDRLRAAHRRGRHGLLLGRRPEVQEPRAAATSTATASPASTSSTSSARSARCRSRSSRSSTATPSAAATSCTSCATCRSRPRTRSSARSGPRVGSFDAGFGVGLLARLVGDKKAKEIWFLCRQYSAQEALAMDLVNKVVPLADLEAEGVQWADEILADEPDRDPVPQVGVPRRDRRPGRAPGVRRQRDRPVLHDRRGARGLDGVPREAPARLPQVPAPPVMPDGAASAPPPARRRSASGSSPPGPRRCPRRWPAWSSGSARRRERRRRSGSTRRSAACAVALLLQVVANFANDLSDFRRGADTPDRQGPLRVAAAGLVTERQLEVAIGDHDRAGRASSGCGWRYVGGPVLLVLGRAGGRRRARLHRRAVAVRLPRPGRGLRVRVLRPRGGRRDGVPPDRAARGAVLGPRRSRPGALITAILVVNNLRDIPTDTAAGKRTLAVMLGERGAQAEYAALLAAAYLVPVGPGRSPAAVVARRCAPLLSLPLAVPLLRTVRGVRRAAGAEPRAQGDRAAVAGLRAAVRGRAGRRRDPGRDAIASLRADRVRVPFRRPFPVAAGMWTRARPGSCG